jgi:hypothetical protein
MRNHIKNLISGLVIVALSAIIIIWTGGAVRVFAEIPKESGYTAIVDFFAAVVGILVGLVTVYGIGLKYNKLTATAKAEEDVKEAEEIEDIARRTRVVFADTEGAEGQTATYTEAGSEVEDNG